MVSLIIVIHRSNFEENGRIVEVAMNGQALYRARREGEREEERKK